MTGERRALLELDDEARRLAQTEFRTPLVIEAGAGTGKTALLTARVVAWCVGPGWGRHADAGDTAEVARAVIERVVAITFTEAAAAEMAQRVGEALSGLAASVAVTGIDRALLDVEDDEVLARRCAALADEVHRLPAVTIHAWCQRQLRGFPLEAGLHPSFEVDADGGLVEAAAVEVVEEALRGLAGDPLADDWRLLASAGVVPPRVAEALRMLAQSAVRQEDLARDPFAPELLGPLLEQVRDGLERFRQAERGRLGSQSRNRTAAAASQVLERVLKLLGGDPDPGELVAVLSQLELKVLQRIALWGRGEFAPTERAVLGEAAPEVAAALAPVAGSLIGLAKVRRDELDAARRVLCDLHGRLTERLRRTGVVTFEDLLVATERLLASAPKVRSELRRRIDQLMVDEFQDTDDTQCRIVSWLALDGAVARRPGLFIVGDPKQSIYGWRRADLAAYHAFAARVAARGGLVRPLVRNFRSVAPILDEVERVVEPVMEEELGIQPPFQPLESTGDRRDDAGFVSGGWRTVEHWPAWPVDAETGDIVTDPRVPEASQLEAVSVAADIRRLHDEGGVPWGDVAVLLRTTTAQEPVLDAFRAVGIPFEVAREREYYRQREVVEAAAVVRCVLEPADRLALLTVLRSDAVGVPDAALVPLWESGLPAAIAELRTADPEALAAIDACVDRAAGAAPADLPGAGDVPRWPAAVRAAAETVAVLRESVRTDPPDRFVEKLRTLWLAEVTASARYLGRFRRARLERFYAELEAALATPDGSLSPVARFLRRAVEEGRDSQLPAEPDVAADAVHILTIHGAKGLDFEHVYLIQIHKETGGVRAGVDVELRRERGALEYRMFGWPTPGFEAAEERRTAQGRAEQVRLLYVAMTRAKRRLVLSGRWRPGGELVTADSATSLADLVAHRLDAESMSAQLERLQRVRGEPDRPVQWVVLGLDAPELSTIANDRRRREFDRDRVEEEARRLAELRADATARSALRITAPVTAVVDEPDGDEVEPDGGAAASRQAALAVGTAVHGLLERLDFERDLGEQLRDAEALLDDVLVRAAAAELVPAARALLASLIETMRDGSCMARLEAISSSIVARELPLVLAPEPGDPVVGALVGTADLVYRDGTRLVIADYKTDAIQGERQIASRADRYRPQLERYAGALRSALALEHPPAMELWFLAADRIVRLHPEVNG